MVVLRSGKRAGRPPKKLPAKLTKQVYQRDGWKCRSCKNSFGLQPHHLVYRSAQGEHAANNLLTLCWKCHRAEHDGFLEIIVEKILEDNVIVRFLRKRGWVP